MKEQIEQRKLSEINRPMNEKLFNNLEKQYQELAKVKAESEQIEKQAIEEMRELIHAEIKKAVDSGLITWTEFSDYLANALYNAGYRKQEWISVDERVPDNDWGKHWKDRNYYLVFTKPSGLMNVAVYGYKEHNWWVDRNSCVLDKKNYKEVTHWMPLPEAPKMKGGAE